MEKKYAYFIVIIIPVVLFGIFLTFYKGEEKKSDKPKVAVSIFPVYDIARNIAGDKIEVVQMLPSNQSPHTYEPTIQDKEKVAGAEAALLVGHGIDDWSKDLLDESTKTYTLDENIDLLKSDEEGNGLDYNPHYWLSPVNASKIAENIYLILSDIDPENKYYYQKQFFDYGTRLENLFKRSYSKLQGADNKNIITFHDAFQYFARDFELKIVASIEPFPGKEPSAQYISELQDLIKQNQIKVLYKEPQLSDSSLEPVKKELNVEIRTLDPIGGVEGRESLLDLIEYNINQIAKPIK